MLNKMQPSDFDKVFSIMEECFPPDERRPYEEQKALLSEPKYNIYVVTDPENNAVKSFITVYLLENFAFVEHFATSPKYRNQGLGGAVLRELFDLLQCEVCLEVEPPETDFAERRIAFYQRNGFFLNEYPYMQPPISKGKNPIPLFLMTSKTPLTQPRFERIKEILYREVYKIR